VAPHIVGQLHRVPPGILREMGCTALGVSVAFLKQPALPGKAPQTKKNLKKF
jgi:hypothetical protein